MSGNWNGLLIWRPLAVATAIAGDNPIILKISSTSAWHCFAFLMAGSCLKKPVKLAQRPLQNRAVKTVITLFELLERSKIFSLESSFSSILKLFQGLSFLSSCSSDLAPLTSPDASGEGASFPCLGLSLDLLWVEARPWSEGQIGILLEKSDTFAGAFGSNCVPAASFSGILNDVYQCRPC